MRKAITAIIDWAETPIGDAVVCGVCYLTLFAGLFLVMLGA